GRGPDHARIQDFAGPSDHARDRRDQGGGRRAEQGSPHWHRRRPRHGWQGTIAGPWHHDVPDFSELTAPMDMDRTACYRAISTRDARFDGRLFVGVRTTGIYCRPICPARTPKFQNVAFFASAAAAQEAGFRPCLRCRPEVSPELAFWRGTSNTVSRALAL